MTDFVIRVEDYIFHVQKDLIMYHSSILQDFLNQNSISMITLINIEPETLKVILHYMYTSHLKINCQNMTEVYRAAGSLRIKEIMAKCIQIMRSKTSSADIYKYTTAWTLGVDCAKYDSLLKILSNLERCTADKEFMNLHVEQVCEIFTAAGLDWTNTKIKSFYQLFLAGLKWIDFDREERFQHTILVMGSIPFKKMSHQELLLCLNPPFAKYVAILPGVKAIIHAALS
ncbi:Kelch-like protein 40b like protein [Argiope bruennichi]|uniref:Kelch-like protein 40b like protein n=2 Tax=Argiope bruennichi TaxID=94029 RepID=A0A8T0EWN5_ARGBR|nr:Kelch-like protein 40b like protein [Argiope bruennichi]